MTPATDTDSSSGYSDSEDESNQLSNHILQQIQQGIYTCLVCTSEIDAHATIWPCESCFRVYDLGCIQDWAKRDSQRELADNLNRNWRCPACKHQSTTIPQTFTCWCGKQVNPEPNEMMPFSCGNSCDAKYDTCIHLCSTVCHPGLHPICSAVGPVLPCNCGAEQRQLPCIITPYADNWSCGKPCTDEVCALHGACPNHGVCHQGLCGECGEGVASRCYCGAEVTEIACCERVPARSTTAADSWIGTHACAAPVAIAFTCGRHSRTLTCQPLSEGLLHPQCPWDPAVIQTCPCGKSPIADLHARQHCTDPVPECEAVCGKPLPCGCTCAQKCHQGDCRCWKVVEARCSCQQHAFTVPCAFVQAGAVPRCTRKCTALLSCRRHVHNLAVCCSGEPQFLERERVRKRAKRRGESGMPLAHLDLSMTIEAEHLCVRPCNRLLLCGKHYDTNATCHFGACRPCMESSSDDLVCHCGQTVVPAPVRCGTTLRCEHQCVRPKACGHRQEFHQCHDEQECPQCTFMVLAACECGKRVLTNVPCFKKDAGTLCGLPCGERMACGHPCGAVCQRACAEGTHSGECAKACRKVRLVCPHFCKQQCHHNESQRHADRNLCDSYTCTDLITLSCACKTHLKQVACGASTNETSAIGTVLACDDECAREARERMLREALKVVPAFTNPYPESVLAVYAKQWKWCSNIETVLVKLVDDNTPMSNDPSERAVVAGMRKTHHFPIMPRPQRAFVHQLAETFGFYAESQDREPYRSIFVQFQPGVTVKPKYTLAAALRLFEEARAEAEAQRTQALTELRAAEAEKCANEVRCNAILIQDCFFGVSQLEVEEALEPIVLKSHIPRPAFKYCSESSFVFYSTETPVSALAMETELYLMSKSFVKVLRAKSLAFATKLTVYDAATNTCMDETEDGFVVVGKAGTPRGSARGTQRGTPEPGSADPNLEAEIGDTSRVETDLKAETPESQPAANSETATPSEATLGEGGVPSPDADLVVSKEKANPEESHPVVSPALLDLTADLAAVSALLETTTLV